MNDLLKELLAEENYVLEEVRALERELVEKQARISAQRQHLLRLTTLRMHAQQTLKDGTDKQETLGI